MRLCSLIAGSITLAGIAAADTIVLKSGRIMECTYLGGTARQIRIEIGNEMRTLNVSEVSRISFSDGLDANAKVTAPNPTSARTELPTAPTEIIPNPVTDSRMFSSAPNAHPEVSGARPGALLTALRGRRASQREYDLWLITSVSNIVRPQSRQEKVLAYCMSTAYGAEHVLDSSAENEYVLQKDGTVLVASGKPPRTVEQRFRAGQQKQMELLNGGGPVVQDCAGSFFWFGTWHNQQMPTDEALRNKAAKARSDLEEIDRTLDPRLVERLPKPESD